MPFHHSDLNKISQDRGGKLGMNKDSIWIIWQKEAETVTTTRLELKSAKCNICKVVSSFPSLANT
jgi:hypothetical protein